MKTMIINGIIGDVYGAPIEMMPYEIIHQRYGTIMTKYIITEKISSRLYSYTDDSEMTLAVIDFLSEFPLINLLNKDFEKEHLGNIMKYFIKYFEPFRGYSLSAFNMFIKYIEDGTYDITDKNTNGGLMRISPVFLYYKKHNINDDQIIKLISYIHYPTHVNEEAIHTSYIYIKLLIEFDKIKDKINKKKIIEIIKNIYDISKYNIKDKLNFIVNNVDIDEYLGLDELIGLDGVLCYETLSVALWCLIKNIDLNPNEILAKGIFYGGDCDTIGAIVGQMSGLLFGEKAINKEWLKNIDIKIFTDKLEQFGF
jgi:ADP-ribosylglycohydrolase